MLQPLSSLERWHEQADPWGYERCPDDGERKRVLLSSIPTRDFARVLDVGCGQGFLTRDLPGRSILGVDVSREAIEKAQRWASERIRFRAASIFELSDVLDPPFDLLIVTGLLYPHYIGNSLRLIYEILDDLLADGGILVSVHIDEWYDARFPYLLAQTHFYSYREYLHRLEVYFK